MNPAARLYEFAASIGALEGYVYHKKNVEDLDMKALQVWTDNLVQAYDHLSGDTRGDIQNGLDKTLNRAISSLENILEAEDVILRRLGKMVGKKTGCSPDDFQKKKWFQK